MVPEDTQIGQGLSHFPSTRLSAIIAARSENEQERVWGLENIVRTYWRPVYKTVRIKWQKSNEDAKDLTQAFFTTAIEKSFFAEFDASKAKFRTFLRMCLDGFLRNEEKARRRLKRGGAYQIMSFDFYDAEQELIHCGPDDDSSPDEYFDREWVRSLYALTISKLKEQLDSQKKSVYFQIFELCDLHDDSQVSYADLSKEFDLPVTSITNCLAYARRQFRQLLLEQLRTITVSEQEFREEAQILLGIKK